MNIDEQMRNYQFSPWWTKQDNKKSAQQDLGFIQKESSVSNYAMQAYPPDWSRIPSKNTEMSDEEFAENIRELAIKIAEMGKSEGNASKGYEAFESELANLRAKYISVASPDRKSAYKNNIWKDTVIYGDFNQKIMEFSKGTWSPYLTEAELSRSSKFNEIFTNAIKEYEAEHGPIPTGPKSANPYSGLAGYKTYSFYNALA